MDDARLLVVDDEPAVTVVIEHAASRWGYHVITARTLADARAVWTADPDPFTALIIDIGLPDGSGLALLEELRRDPGRGDTPAIILTGAGDDGTLEAAQALEATVVTKPFGPHKLRGILDGLVTNRGEGS